jgi:transcriptional regulator with XRE-family HTH domain
MDIGTAIREIRLKSLMSQSDFANALAVSFSTVNRWENGKAIPSFKALKRIKEFCTSNGIDFALNKYIASKIISE